MDMRGGQSSASRNPTRTSTLLHKVLQVPGWSSHSWSFCDTRQLTGNGELHFTAGPQGCLQPVCEPSSCVNPVEKTMERRALLKNAVAAAALSDGRLRVWK